MKIIDICYDISGMSTLRKYYINNNIKEYSIIYLPLALSIGDIKNDLYNRTIFDVELKSKINELLNSINDNTIIRVFSSRINVEEYLLLLFICNLFKNKNNKVEVIFTSDYLNVHTLGALSYEEIVNVLKNKKELSKKEIKQYSKMWDNIVKINSEVRVLEKNKIINKKYSDFDEIIINTLEKLGKCRETQLIGKLLANSITSSFDVNVYGYLVDRLINNNEINVINNNIIERNNQKNRITKFI